MVLGKVLRVVGSLLLLMMIVSGLNLLNSSSYSPTTLSGSHPYIIELNTSIAPESVFLLSRDEVFLVGECNGSSVAEILNVSNPYIKPQVIQTYPLMGSVTAVATNGYPVERIAIGTDKGDLTIFKVDGGKIYLLLHAVLGTDFQVNKLLVMKGSKDYKVAALVSETKRSGGVCTNCHVYVFDENSGNVLRIGPYEGNATLSIGNVLPQDMTAAIIVNEGNYYYDASHFVVTWLPYNFYSLMINVTYRSTGGEIKPAAGALVELLAYNPSIRETFKYGVNLDRRGVTEIPIPLGYAVNITVTDVEGRKYYGHVDAITESSLVRKAYVSIVMNASPVTLDASLFYKTPPYELASPHILNVDKVPETFTFITSLNDARINPASTGLSLLKGGKSNYYILYYYDPASGSAYIRTYDSNYRFINEVADYVGKSLKSLGAFTYPDGRLVITAYDSGKIKSYSIDNDGVSHFLYELRVGNNVRKFKVIPSSGTYIYITHTDTGLQIVRELPYQVPILRLGTRLGYGEGAVDSDVSSDLNTVVIAYPNKLFVGENLKNVIMEGKPVDMDKFKAPTLTLHLLPPPHGTLNGTVVTMQYPGGKLIKEITAPSGAVLQFPNIIPGEKYTLIVNHPAPYVMTFQETITPQNYSDLNIYLNLAYKIYNVTVSVSDSITGEKPLTPYDIYVDNKLVASKVNVMKVTLPLIYGTHEIKVTPSKGYENVYESYSTTVTVPKTSEINATLKRIVYPVQVMVVDRYSKTLLAPILVKVKGVGSKIISFGGDKATFSLPYGNYTVIAEPIEGYDNIYLSASVRLSVTKPTTTSIVLERKSYTLNISIVDKTAGKVITPFNIFVNSTQVAASVKDFANVTLPYGVYTVSILPASGGEAVYNVPRPKEIELFNNSEVIFPLTRKFYKIKILVIDDIGSPIKNAEVTFYSIDKRAQITTLLTDSSGYVYGSLFYGGYKVTVNAKGFYTEEQDIFVNKDTELTIQLHPQPLTIIIRYLPVIAIVVIAVLAMFLALKIKAKIVERMPREELF